MCVWFLFCFCFTHCSQEELLCRAEDAKGIPASDPMVGSAEGRHEVRLCSEAGFPAASGSQWALLSSLTPVLGSEAGPSHLCLYLPPDSPPETKLVSSLCLFLHPPPHSRKLSSLTFTYVHLRYGDVWSPLPYLMNQALVRVLTNATWSKKVPEQVFLVLPPGGKTSHLSGPP